MVSPEAPNKNNFSNPQEEQSKAAKHKKTVRHTSPIIWAGRVIVPIIIFAGIGATIKYHYDFGTQNDIAGIIQDIKGFPIEWEYTLLQWQAHEAIKARLKQPVPPTFDNSLSFINAEAGVNAEPVSDSHLKSFLGNNSDPIQPDSLALPKATLLFPGRLETGDKIAISTPYIQQGFNPLSQKIEPMPAGKEILFSRSGTEIDAAAMLGINTDNYEAFQITPLIVNGRAYFAGEALRFQGPDNSVWILRVTEPDDVRGLVPMDNIANAPVLDVSTEKDINAQKGEIVKRGTPTLKTNGSDTKIRLDLRVYLPNVDGFVPVVINFDTDGNKLVYKTPGQP